MVSLLLMHNVHPLTFQWDPKHGLFQNCTPLYIPLEQGSRLNDDDDGCDDGKIQSKEVDFNEIWKEKNIRECVRDALNSQVQSLRTRERNWVES